MRRCSSVVMPWVRSSAMPLGQRRIVRGRARPPSAVVTILTGWKLNTAMSDQRQEPTGSPLVASRRRVRGVLDDAKAVVAWRARGSPPCRSALAAKCTGMTTLGRRPARLARSRSFCASAAHADVVGARIDVDEIDVGAAVARAVGGGDEGVGHGPHHDRPGRRRARGRRCAAPRWRCSPRPRAARGTAPRTPPRSGRPPGPGSASPTAARRRRPGCRPRRSPGGRTGSCAPHLDAVGGSRRPPGSADWCRSCIRNPRPPASPVSPVALVA